MPGFLAKVDYAVPGLGSLNAASFTLGFLASGIMLALAAYPLVHLFSAVLPHHLPVRRGISRRPGDRPADQTGAK